MADGGLVGVIETIFDKPELWGDLSLSQADLETLRVIHTSLTKPVSKEEAQVFMAELDSFSFGQTMKAQRDELLDAMKDIKTRTLEWNANKLGGVSIQRKRWQLLGVIAIDAITNVTE